MPFVEIFVSENRPAEQRAKHRLHRRATEVPEQAPANVGRHPAFERRRARPSSTSSRRHRLPSIPLPSIGSPHRSR